MAFMTGKGYCMGGRPMFQPNARDDLLVVGEKGSSWSFGLTGHKGNDDFLCAPKKSRRRTFFVGKCQ